MCGLEVGLLLMLMLCFVGVMVVIFYDIEFMEVMNFIYVVRVDFNGFVIVS